MPGCLCAGYGPGSFTKFFIHKILFFYRKHLVLPCEGTISSWISTVEAEPGFLEEVLHAIAQFPDEKRDVNYLPCNIYRKSTTVG